jgi:hypothetical protein
MKSHLTFVVGLIAAVSSVSTAAPVWKIQEVYSSANGHVQFIKLFAATDGQNSLTGETLGFSNGGNVVRSITFDRNQVGATSNRAILVGTSSLSTLYGVRPDYLIPAGFLSGGATKAINFANGADVVDLTSLPTDGVNSLNGLIAKSNPRATAILPQATPENFSGQSATVTGPPLLPNPILFVTQFPIPEDFTTVTSVFGNHSGSLSSAGRGGDLYIRYPDGKLKNLTAAAGYGNTGRQGANAIAVREPCVHWDGKKAVFSMVIGAPTERYQVAQYYWQLYEVTGLGLGEKPVITKVPNQPAQYNNVSPVYGTDDRIIFTTDMPRNRQRHHYPQLDEYEEAPTNTGLWSLNPATGNIFLLDHSPSGSFTPSVDSFGRVIFTRWDHLQRDQQADTDAINGTNTYGTFDYASESATAEILPDKTEVFPEPRSARTDLLAGTNLEGHTFNQFFPWQLNEDGTELETLNHIGRHELHRYFNRSLNDDPNLREFSAENSGRLNPREVENFLHIKEDPKSPGNYFAVDAPEFETHAAGQIVRLHGRPRVNPDQMTARYITSRLTRGVSAENATAPPAHSGHYRNPLPLSDGSLVAVHTGETRADLNIGNRTAPRSRYDFRLVTLRSVNGTHIANQPLTNGIRKSLSYFDPDVLVGYTGELWELDPVEVRARPRPARRNSSLPAPEQAVFNEEGVSEAALRSYLTQKNLALIVSRNLTTRDHADIQQPFNLRVAGTSTQSIGAPGKIYDIAHLQIYQADLLRGKGLTPGETTPQPGRRVLARAMHGPQNPANPSGPEGSVRLAADGSMAAFVPASRALTWELTDPAGTSVVRERYWLTFQKGEIRTCTSCHGLNTSDQANQPVPVNKPEALRELLRFWKTLPPGGP